MTPPPGSLSSCPHCGGMTVIERHSALGWRCGACGGPRVPTDPSVPRSGQELPVLREARHAYAGTFGWRASGIALSVIAVMLTLFGGLFMLASLVAGGVIAAIGVAGFVVALSLLGRAKKSEAVAREKLLDGWALVAEEVLRAAGREMTAAEIAQAMQTTEAHADAFLKKLSVHDRAGMRVADDAQIRYRIADALPEASDAIDVEEPAAEKMRR